MEDEQKNQARAGLGGLPGITHNDRYWKKKKIDIGERVVIPVRKQIVNKMLLA